MERQGDFTLLRSVSALVVRNTMRRRGIATQLVKNQLKRVKQEGAKKRLPADDNRSRVLRQIWIPCP